MTHENLSYTGLLTQLKTQGLIENEEVDRIVEHMHFPRSAGEPFYLRIMAGIGAWFAALFFILFLFTAELLKSDEAAIVWGLAFLIGALVLSQLRNTTFVDQLCLAGAFVGNCLLVGGLVEFFNYDELSAAVIAHGAVCVVVYPLYNNVVYRFCAPVMLAILATVWLLEEDAYSLIHALIGLEAFLVGVLFLVKNPRRSLNPLAYAAAAMLPATLLFFHVGMLDIGGIDFHEPLWPTTLLLTAGLLYLCGHLAGKTKRMKQPWFLLAVAATVLLGVFTTPGLLVALGLLIIGYAYDDRILTGFAYVFLPTFLVLFYYAMNVSLAYKSWVVAGSGIVLLVVRGIAGYLQTRDRSMKEVVQS